MLLSLFHRSGGDSALLEWKVGTFLLAAAFGLAGISLEIPWLRTTALIVLMGGFGLRALAARTSGSDGNEPAIDEPEAKIDE